ncbi:MAG: phosphopyruvate hydratase [Caldisericia bacterium]
MSRIEDIFARQIIDSRGNPTIEVDVRTDDDFFGRAAVPSGASTGIREALELRDGNPNFFLGKSVEQAINNINETINNELFDVNVLDQVEVDNIMLQLDGTENKKKLGANAILAVSMAVARAAANSLNIPLYRYLGGPIARRLPVPMMNVINGGAHADNNLDLQEFMIFPSGASSFSEGLRMGIEIYHTLKKLLKEKNLSTAVGDEGGFAPNLKSHEEAFQLLISAIEKAGYKPGEDCNLTIDAASSEIWEDGKYKFEGEMITSYDLNAWYEKMIAKYPIVSIEDGMAEQDHDGWKLHTKSLKDKIQIVGDDLFVTNPSIFAQGIKDGMANSILIKLNQVGSVKETWDAIRMAKDNGYSYVISHRSGETADSFISHLAVASESGQIKTGAPARTERVEKYNELLRIEEELGENAIY